MHTATESSLLSQNQVLPENEADARRHLLTVNVEDYFQVGVFQKYIQSDNWYRFDSRLSENIDRVLALLNEHHTTATFFVLGWTADNQPELVERIAAAGHDVASRGYLHQNLLRLPRNEIRRDLERSRVAIERVTGRPVDGFRLSDGWLDRDSLWFLDEVAAAGFRYDSSLMPRRRDFGGAAQWRSIRTVETANGPLLEIPLTTIPTLAGWLPIAGGNYQRQLPDFLMRRLVQKSVDRNVSPYVMYFQVWELDDEQPELSVAGSITRLRHYRKLGKYQRILPRYLEQFRFTSVRDHAADVHSPLHSLTEPRADYRTPQDIVRDADETLAQVAASEDLLPGEQIVPDDPARQRTDVTIVIPCYNEEKTLRYLANTLTSVTQRLSQDYRPQFLFVDDCSTDGTFDVLQQQFAGDDRVSVIRHSENQGVSAAILTGLEHAGTDVVCSMDCDCSYDPHELARMLPLLTDDVSMVTASPYHRDGHVRNVPGWRLVLSKGLSALYQKLLRQPLATWTACFRVYRKSHIEDLPLTESGFLGTAELAAQLVLHGRKIAEHPATLEVRLFGLSKMKTFRAILSHLKLLSRITGLRLRRGLPAAADDSKQTSEPSALLDS
ncbi:MAG: glycosyltransferase [Planctomycetaceae bacterium]|nr:glycosyltransferase [Planctomycetaceae bacterium]